MVSFYQVHSLNQELKISPGGFCFCFINILDTRIDISVKSSDCIWLGGSMTWQDNNRKIYGLNGNILLMSVRFCLSDISHWEDDLATEVIRCDLVSPLRRETVWMTRAIVTVTVGGPGARESLRSTGGRPHCPSLHMLGWLSTMAANKTDAGNNHHHDFHHIYITIPSVYVYVLYHISIISLSTFCP